MIINNHSNNIDNDYYKLGLSHYYLIVIDNVSPTMIINYILMSMLVDSKIETEMKFTYMLSVKVFF